MNRWNYLVPWLATLTICVVFAGPGFAAEEAQSFEPYTGPPILLDTPDAPPPASFVEKQVNTEKYPDGKVRLEREIARYSDNQFVADGFYREFYPSGEKFAEGQNKNGRQVGEWTYWHENGKVSRKVTFKNGLPDGSWDVLSADGAVIAKRGYKDGRRDGTWVIYDAAGKQPLREEVYTEGKPNGTWKVWYASGQLKTQLGLKDGVRDGAATEWDEQGNKRAELNYKDGKVHGKVTAWGADGTEVTQEYDEGKLIKESKQ